MEKQEQQMGSQPRQNSSTDRSDQHKKIQSRFGKRKRRFSWKRKNKVGKKGPVSKSVGAVVLNQKNEILLVFQNKNKYWEFPKGKVEHAERELETLRREIFEETGIEKYRIFPRFRKVMQYEFQYKGKLIRRVVVYFLIQTRDEVKISDEHSNFKWLSIPEAKKFLKHKNQSRLLDEVNKRLRQISKQQ